MMQTREGTRATESAIETASEAYATISRSRDRINAAEAQGIYVEDEIQRRREAEAGAARQAVEQRLASEDKSLETARQRVRTKLEMAKAISSDEAALAQSSVGLILDDPMANPEQVLDLYERLFDTKSDRIVLESLIERLIKVLPQGGKRDAFEARFRHFEEQLEDGLPEEERQARASLRELDEVSGYLVAVRGVTNNGIEMLLDPRSRPNMTLYSKAVVFEKANAGMPLADQALGRAPVSERAAS